MQDSSDGYNAAPTLSTPNAPLPESRGDRATLRAMLAWLGHVQTPARRAPTHSVRLVWCALFAHADYSSGEAFPRLRVLAELCALSLRCVRNAIRTLEALGLVRSQFRTGHATLYRLTLPTQTPARAAPRHPGTPARSTAQTPARQAALPAAKPRQQTPRKATFQTLQTPAHLPTQTPAMSAGTPATSAAPPRQPVPPEQLREENKKTTLHAPALAQTPARNAAQEPAQTPAQSTPDTAKCPRATPSAPACASATGPAEPETTPARVETPASPKARPARRARARAEAIAQDLAAAWTVPSTPAPIAAPIAAPDPGTSSPPAPHPGTTPPHPSPPAPLAAVLARVQQRHAAGGGRR